MNSSNNSSKNSSNNSSNNSYNNISNEKIWAVIESYFRDKHLDQLVRHQIESYNNFIDYQLFKTIQMFNPIKIVSEQDYDAENDKYFLEIFITFTNFNIYRPQIHENNGAIKLMFPQEARLRNFTYSSVMTIDINIKYVIRSKENLSEIKILNKIIPQVNIGRIPIMLKSNICILTQYKHVDNNYTGECKYDAGGYFIINGSEKIVLGQERIAENKIYVFNTSKNTKYSYIAEIKSVPDFKCISPKKITVMISSKDNGFGFSINILLARLKQPIPLFIIFRALGIISDKEICEHIILDVDNEKQQIILEILKASIIEANNYLSKEECFKYVNSQAMYTPINMDKEMGIRKKNDFTLDILNNDLFPHCHTIKEKLYFLGYMTNKLIQTYLEWRKPDDRDSYLNKRIDMTGVLLNNLFRNYFNKLVKDMEKQIIREINTGSWKSTEDYINIISKSNINKIVKSSTIELGIKKALSTGDFSIKQSNTSKVGVAQVLTRLTYISAISHIRRIATPTDKSGTLIPPRKLHNTTWGFLCPAETPEGQSVGVVKNLSYMTHITIYSNVEPLYDYINSHIISFEQIDLSKDLFDKVKVFINGCWIGIAKEPYQLYCDLKNKKYSGIINIYTSIIFDINNKEIRICNDAGRVVRPVFRVSPLNNNILINKEIIKSLVKKELEWNNLLLSIKLKDSVIEYIDPEEQSYSMISMSVKDLYINNSSSSNIQKYTHCEIHPSTIFGVAASCIPFPDYNQSPRNTYQSAQSKQALGIYASNYNERMDKTSYILTYPERPLVETRVMNILKINELPAGCNIIVAIMTHTGYNQEDSLLINKGSIDRGLFLATIYHTEKDEDKQKINGDEEIRCKPNPTKTKGMKMAANYNKVNNKGIIPENILVENKDIIISKIIPIKENRNDNTKIIKYEDQSKMFKTTEETFIDKNYIDRNSDGYNFCKVRLRTLRKPVIGDKFSSRSGQKGTCGNIIPEEDMPFTSSGIRPDIIINPHAIPSRMTMAQLKEMLLCKVLLSLGLFGDGTSFGDLSVNSICDELLKCNFNMHGNELLYSGLTGEQHECSVFMGPCFYQRLKHMVSDKQHSRSYGPPVSFTRQPAEGRSRGGGLRIGEMERDAIISHGASQFLRSRFYNCSDKYQINVCRKCGMIATCNHNINIYKCHTCENTTDFAYVEIPYACKLLFHELQTMNIVPRIVCSS
jgi:DNA-directed RNA polymerase II subunit RPB2